MERLIIDGDGAELLDGELVGQLWDLVQDFPITITITVDVDEKVTNQDNQNVLAFGGVDGGPERPTYGVDFCRQEPTNGNR